MFVEPLDGVLRTDAEVGSEYLRGIGGAGEPNHTVPAVCELPRTAQGGERRGLPGACRADEHIDGARGSGDEGDRCSLVGAEPAASTIGPAGDALEQVMRHERGGVGVGETQEEVFSIEHLLGGVQGAVLDAERAAAVGALEVCGRHGQLWRGELHGCGFCPVGDQAGDRFPIGD